MGDICTWMIHAGRIFLSSHISKKSKDRFFFVYGHEEHVVFHFQKRKIEKHGFSWESNWGYTTNMRKTKINYWNNILTKYSNNDNEENSHPDYVVFHFKKRIIEKRGFSWESNWGYTTNMRKTKINYWNNVLTEYNNNDNEENSHPININAQIILNFRLFQFLLF